MPRYIDADAFIKELEADIKEFGEPNINTQPIAYGTVLGIESVLDLAKELPAADVVPKSEVEKFAEDIKLEFYREFDEIIPSIMADKIEEFKKKYTEGEDKPASEEKYFSPEDVRKMTPQEVREKYTAIRKSMERW